MKQIIKFLYMMFIATSLFGQKQLDVPKTNITQRFNEHLSKSLEELKLKDLRTSKDSLNIRIWQSQSVFTLNKNSDSTYSDYKIYTTKLRNDYKVNLKSEKLVKTFSFAKNITQSILDSLLITNLMSLKGYNDFRIDGSYVFIEIATKKIYRIISCNLTDIEQNKNYAIAHIIKILDNAINFQKTKNIFLNSLPAGEYTWGLTNIHIDRFLNKNIVKTDFYSYAEKKIRTVFNISDKTDHWNYPLILINNKPSFISDLNKYTKNQIFSFKIFKPHKGITSLYGSNGRNGVVKIETNVRK